MSQSQALRTLQLFSLMTKVQKRFRTFLPICLEICSGIFKLWCLVIARPCKVLPNVVFALGGSSVRFTLVSSCVRCVQSYVLWPTYKQGVFCNNCSMECTVRVTIGESRNFMSSSLFDMGEGLLKSNSLVFVQRYTKASISYLTRKTKHSYRRLNDDKTQGI